MAPLLEARQVSKVFGGGLFDKRVTIALDHFSFAVESSPPQVTAIVGESGSGKTTLARLLLGLISPSSGEVLYQGTDIRKLEPEGRGSFLRDVQMIFQDPYEVYNPFYRLEQSRAAACFLYSNTASALAADQLNEVISTANV
jgi:ABC-type oligopeptide transport system ATPase subunit